MQIRYERRIIKTDIKEIWFNKYEVIKQIGFGGSATVFLVKHLKLHTVRAVKRIPKDHMLYSQLMNETNILKELKHINIPTIYDIEEDEHFSYIIEEYVEGILLKTFRLNKDVIDEELMINYVLQLCDVIQYLHSFERKILYLDLKPDNIIISNKLIKLIDFGSATYYEDLNTRRYATGTRGYASPEQYKSNLIDERSDIYGIGMILFFLITGVTFNKNINSIVNIDEIQSCSKALKHIINKCLKYNPSQRFKSITELKNKLLQLNKCSNISIKKSKNTLSISIASSQSRLGVTHISLLLTSYFNQYTVRCLYSEKNNTQTINKIIKRYQEINEKDYIYQIKNCYFIPNYNEMVQVDKNNFSVEIKDFGILTDDNIEEFNQSEFKLILIGAKDWEIDESEHLLQLPLSDENTYFLFNFIDGRTYQKVAKHMGGHKCYRFPYEPDPFLISNVAPIKELVNDIFSIESPSVREKLFARIRGYK